MYRIDKLLKSDQKLFHTSDLALLWGISDKNTLYTAIKRYSQKGILLPVQKGLYSTVPLNSIDPLRLGIGFLHQYAYLSCESVLSQQGIIFQHGHDITLVSDKSTRFTCGNFTYRVRRLTNTCLYNDNGIEKQNGILTATAERACADMLYFNPRYHFDNRKGIDWEKMKAIQKEVYGI